MADSNSNPPACVIFMKLPESRARKPRHGLPRYYYPREGLEQDYFTRTGDGRKLPADLSLSMIANKKFESQIGRLLTQLNGEGYDVSACEAELRAMRELIRMVDGELDKLFFDVMAFRDRPTSPVFD